MSSPNERQLTPFEASTVLYAIDNLDVDESGLDAKDQLALEQAATKLRKIAANR